MAEARFRKVVRRESCFLGKRHLPAGMMHGLALATVLSCMPSSDAAVRDAPEGHPLLTAGSQPLLDLSEIAEMPLQSPGVVRGVTGSLGGRTLFWSDTAVFLADEALPWARLCTDAVIRPRAAGIVSNGDVEIIDHLRGVVFRVLPTGSCVTKSQIHLLSDVIAASATPDSWIILGRMKSVLALIRMRNDTAAVLVARLPDWLSSSPGGAMI